MNNKLNFLNKGISTPVGILIILVCSLVAGGVFLWQLGQWPKEEIKIPTDETTNWSTYRNEEYGFEVNYPKDIIFSSTGPNLEQQKLDRGEVISGTVAPSYDTIVFSAKDNVKQFTIEIFHPQERPAFYPNSYGPCDLRWGITSSIDEKTITVNNIEVFKRTIKAQKDEEEAPIFRSCYYFRNRDKNLIVLGSVGFINLSELEKEDLILEKVISTINLSQLDETADWQTYRNEKYGFEFKYPKEWIIEETRYHGYFASDRYPGLVLILGEREEIERQHKQPGLPRGNILVTISSVDCGIGSGYEWFVRLSGYCREDKIFKEVFVNKFKLMVFACKDFCYEFCEPQERIPSLRAIVCNTNEEGCIEIGSVVGENYEKSRDFFVNQFLPTLKIDSDFDNIKCTESKG